MSLSDPLSASSVLLALLAILYGTWYADITHAIAISFPAQVANRGNERNKVVSTLFTKSAPLALGALLTSLIFLARGLGIVSAGWGCRGDKSCTYNDVQAAFVIIELFVVILAASAIFQAGRLVVRWIESYKG